MKDLKNNLAKGVEVLTNGQLQEEKLQVEQDSIDSLYASSAVVYLKKSYSSVL